MNLSRIDQFESVGKFYIFSNSNPKVFADNSIVPYASFHTLKVKQDAANQLEYHINKMKRERENKMNCKGRSKADVFQLFLSL